jgi:hypothetical protein
MIMVTWCKMTHANKEKILVFPTPKDAMKKGCAEYS